MTLEVVRNALVYIALTLSIATAVLAAWVFNILRVGGTIGSDPMNTTEFWISVVILSLVIVAWLVNAVYIFKLSRG